MTHSKKTAINSSRTEWHCIIIIMYVLKIRSYDSKVPSILNNHINLYHNVRKLPYKIYSEEPYTTKCEIRIQKEREINGERMYACVYVCVCLDVHKHLQDNVK